MCQAGDGARGWVRQEGAPRELGEAEYEEAAAAFGIVGYQAMLRRALRDEKREAEGRKPKPKWVSATTPPKPPPTPPGSVPGR